MKDYSTLRGFNYTQSSTVSDTGFWDHYDHAIVDRELGYAHRLGLNSARVFLPYSSYHRDAQAFLSSVKDFVQTAWKHGISTSPIIYHGFRFLPEDFEYKPTVAGTLPPLPKTVLTPACWTLGETYFDDLLAAIGGEPGLLFWDISNEPGYHDDFLTWYDGEPEYLQTFRQKPDMEVLRANQEKTWEIVRHFCKYVKAKDPRHDIGIGNIFIFETEPSRTIDLVDIIIFHDYSATRGRMRRIYDMAKALQEKYGKPVINNETCCLCRSNPYDMTLEMLEEYKFGWYLFELMIGADGWNRVHGVVYPDGTVRDPSIVAALYGFYRKRGEGILTANVNQEHYVNDLARRAGLLLEEMNSNAFARRSDDAQRLLELCEYAANLLEAGELIPMAYPPTAKVAAYRRQAKPDTDEIKAWLCELVKTLKAACYLV